MYLMGMFNKHKGYDQMKTLFPSAHSKFIQWGESFPAPGYGSLTILKNYLLIKI